MIHEATGHIVCSCSQYSFERRKIVSFLPPFHSRLRGTKILFHYLCTLHNVISFFVMLKIAGYWWSTNSLQFLKLMCLNERADWMFIFQESIIVLFDIVDVYGFRIMHSNLFTRVWAMGDGPSLNFKSHQPIISPIHICDFIAHCQTYSMDVFQ